MRKIATLQLKIVIECVLKRLELIIVAQHNIRW